MEAVVEESVRSLWPDVADPLFTVGRVLRRVFGCWHRDMSLPFSRDNETYRRCVACGARRLFDLERWAMVGPYYYPKQASARKWCVAANRSAEAM